MRLSRIAFFMAGVCLALMPILLPEIAAQAAAGGQDASRLTPEQRVDAETVLKVIEKIRAESATVPAGGPRSVAISERELNAYIAHRIEADKEEILTDLRLKLFAENRIEGLAVVDLRNRKLPAFIKPMMNIVFAGVIESRPGEARIRFESLYLEQQRIQTSFVDFVIAAVSELDGTEPIRLDDWYALPYGISGLETQRGRLVAAY